MRIVHLCCVAPPQGGGMGAVADREVRLLRAAGEEATLVAPRMNAKTKDEGIAIGDRVVRRWSVGVGNAARILGLTRLTRGADIVHLHYPFYGTAGAVARLRRRGKIRKLVVTLHMDAQVPGWRGAFFELHRRFFQTRILDTADLLLVSSMDYARSSSFEPYAAHHDPRLAELPFGVEADRFTPGPSQRDRFGIPSDARVIGTVSVMDKAHPFKGIDVLIRAVACLPSSVHLLLVGDGDLRSSYEQLAARLNLSDRCHFAGRLDDAGLVEALRTMEIFAFPSTSGAEAFGLAMLEAMSCGVPVIASDLPGVRSVAHDAGVIVEPRRTDVLARAIESLFRDESRRGRLGAAAREKALGYSWERHGERLLEHYRRLCASPS